MDIVSFDHLAIPPDLDASANDLLIEAYGVGDGDANEGANDGSDGGSDGGSDPERYRAVLAVDPNAGVIGHLAAFVRRVDQNGVGFDLGMIGDVATRKAFQRRGVATRLVEEAHSYFRGQNFAFSMLFAYDPPVYVSSGYKLMSDEMHFVGRDGQPKTCVYRGSMICELTPQPWQSGLVNLNGRPV